SLAAMPAARAALDELVRAHLLTEHLPGRFRFHDLLRAYAAERAHAEDDEASRQAAIGRVLGRYLHTANTAALPLRAGPAARPRGDPRSLASVPRGLGYVCVHLGRSSDAQGHYRQALHHSRDDPDGQARAHHGIAWTFGQQHDYRNALTHSQRALELAAALG